MDIKDNINVDKLNTQYLNTYNEIKKLMLKHDRVLCVRPTSWGKSYNIVRKLILENNKCLLIVPSINLKNQYSQFNLPINIVTMAKINYLSSMEEEKLFKDIDYIIIDEAHHICSATVSGRLLNVLINKYKVKCLGFTATPERNDKINVLKDFYNNIQVTPLYLDEAIKQQVLPKLKYVRSFVDDEEKLTQKLKEIDRYEFNNIFNVPSILKRHITEDRLNNFKAIIYIPRKTMNSKTFNIIYSWFHTAFPKYEINIYNQSWHQDKLTNKSELEKFKEVKRKNVIDLMLNIDMLSEGSHIENVYTVILLRFTKSIPKYLQQIGRAINTHNKDNFQQPLIIDIVSNLTRLKDKEDIIRYQRCSMGYGSLPKEEYMNSITIVDELYPYMDKLNNILRIAKPWTVEEDEYLKTNYNGKNIKELEEKLNRTYYSIAKRLNRLGINTILVQNKKLESIKKFLTQNENETYSRNFLSKKFGINYKTLDELISQNPQLIPYIKFSHNFSSVKSKEITEIEQGIIEGYETSDKTINQILLDFNFPIDNSLQQRLSKYLHYHNLKFKKS